MLARTSSLLDLAGAVPVPAEKRGAAWQEGSAAFTGGAGDDPRVSVFLDTNVLIRHLTGDPPVQARRAMAFLVAADELLVPDLVVAEVVFALESFYEVKRERVAELSGR